MTELVEVKPDRDKNEKALAELRALSSDLQEKGIRAALKAGAKPLQTAMQMNAPDDPKTGGSRLQKAINTTLAKTGTVVRSGAGGRVVQLDKDEVGYVVGPNKRIGKRSVAYIAWFLEKGTKKHRINPKPKRGWILGTLFIDGRWHRGGVDHPGITGKNWMANSFNSSANQVEVGFYTGLEKWLDKYGR